MQGNGFTKIWDKTNDLVERVIFHVNQHADGVMAKLEPGARRGHRGHDKKSDIALNKPQPVQNLPGKERPASAGRQKSGGGEKISIEPIQKHTGLPGKKNPTPTPEAAREINRKKINRAAPSEPSNPFLPIIAAMATDQNAEGEEQIFIQLKGEEGWRPLGPIQGSPKIGISDSEE